MSLTIGDIVRVTQICSYLGQTCENVFFYRVDALPVDQSGLSDYEQIATSFNESVRIFELPVASVDVLYGLTQVDNITNGVDFGAVDNPTAGIVESDPLASFYALNFILRRTNKLTRNGSKRFTGVTESQVDGNVYVGSLTPINNLAAALSAPLTDATLPTPVAFAIPVIVGRKLVSGTYVYDLTKVNPVASAALTAVSTQRSRKVGHGS